VKSVGQSLMLRDSWCFSWELLCWAMGTIQKPRGKGMPDLGSCYHKIGEDTSQWEDLSACSSEL
jgi:hypothetical protein